MYHKRPKPHFYLIKKQTLNSRLIKLVQIILLHLRDPNGYKFLIFLLFGKKISEIATLLHLRRELQQK